MLNVCLTLDPKCKAACETCVKDNMAIIGIDSFFDVVSSVDSKGLHYQDFEILVRINKPSPDFAGGVHVDKDDFDVDVGGQGIMFRVRE